MTATRKRKTPAKMLRLRGSRLADFEPLFPAEEKLRQCAARGENCEVDGYTDKRPQKATANNKIRAAFLRYMILGGCEKSPVHARGINLVGAFVLCRDDGLHGKCLDLEAAIIPHDAGLFDCTIDGVVVLRGASAKTMIMNGSLVEGLIADRLKTTGSVFLRDGFCATGEVRLTGAKLGGSLECDSGILVGLEKSLSCDGLETTGGVFLRDGFCATGEVRLLGAKLGGDLDCRNGVFEADLNTQNAIVEGNFLLDGKFRADKTVYLRNTQIRGNLNCKGGTFADSNIALIANRAKIDGNVDLGEITANGTIELTGTEIGGDFTPQGAVLLGTPALQLRNSKIGGTLFWRSLGFVNGEVNFGGAACTTINMDDKSWMRKRTKYPDYRPKDDAEEGEEQAKPEADAAPAEEAPPEKPIQYDTRLANFTYKGFSELPKGCDAAFWIEWLNQQPNEHLAASFRPRPFEQLAGVLDSMGFEEEARAIRIEKQRLQTKFLAKHALAGKGGFKPMHWLRVFWQRIIGVVVAYGYQPGRALLWLIGLVGIGWLVFFLAAEKGIMTPTHPLVFKEARAGGSIPKICAENWVVFKHPDCAAQMPSEYSEFSPLVYSIDVALPIVDLRQQADWAPRVTTTAGVRHRLGYIIRIWEWLQIGFGWALSLLFVSAIGGIIRR